MYFAVNKNTIQYNNQTRDRVISIKPSAWDISSESSGSSNRLVVVAQASYGDCRIIKLP